MIYSPGRAQQRGIGGKTALDYALDHGEEAVIQLLRDSSNGSREGVGATHGSPVPGVCWDRGGLSSMFLSQVEGEGPLGGERAVFGA